MTAPFEEPVPDEVLAEWEMFWASIVAPDGELIVEQVMRELADYSALMTRVSKVYMHITGGRMSKTNYTAEGVIEVADEHIERLIAEAIADHDRELDEAT